MLGAMVKESPTMGQAYYMLVAFNIVQEGRVVKNIEQINSDTLIREFTMERVSRSEADDKLQANSGWTPIANYFK
jgi:hypothetical protein